LEQRIPNLNPIIVLWTVSINQQSPYSVNLNSTHLVNNHVNRPVRI